MPNEIARIQIEERVKSRVRMQIRRPGDEAFSFLSHQIPHDLGTTELPL